MQKMKKAKVSDYDVWYCDCTAMMLMVAGMNNEMIEVPITTDANVDEVVEIRYNNTSLTSIVVEPLYKKEFPELYKGKKAIHVPVATWVMYRDIMGEWPDENRAGRFPV